MSEKKVVLVITDGIGHSDKKTYNAFYNAKKPGYDYLFKNVPYSFIETSGKAVGLPNNQMGNSEVGHQTIGSGRIIPQDIVRIDNAISEGILEKKPEICDFLKNHKVVHILGLLSDGGIHSHISHLVTISKIAAKNNKVFLHLVSDGRDVAFDSLRRYLKMLFGVIKHNRNIKIATLGGRYYVMDRDNNWDRIKKAYDCIVDGKNKTDLSICDYVKDSYNRGIYDEFIAPASFDDYNGVNPEDGFIFVNFRNDRMREIVKAITQKDFYEFERNKVISSFVTMTEYDRNFSCPVIFKKFNPDNIAAEVISNSGLPQAHLAETEKYAHVTFFFNGGREKPFDKEERILVDSPKVERYDVIPEMSASKVCSNVLNMMDMGNNFIVVNFANPDMIGHTGNYDAAVKAVEVVDEQLRKIIQKAKSKNYSVIITSDHGNCEEMRGEDGKMLTQHTTNDVYCFVLSRGVKYLNRGSLTNIAPTALKLLGLNVPKEMDVALF